MVIDFHAHIFRSAAAFPQPWLDGIYGFKKSVMGREAFEQWKEAFNKSGTVEELIKDMDRAGVEKSVVLALDFGIMCGKEAEISIWDVNKYVSEAQQKYPDRIIGFAGVDPLRGEEAISLLETAVKKWGLRGVKIIASKFKVSDPSVRPFMSKVDELKIPALVHMGSDPPPYLMRNGNPEDLDVLSSEFPKTKFVAAHCARGYVELLGEIMHFKEGQVYADLSGLQYEVMKSPWHFTLQLRYLMDKVPNSIVMGSDWPFIKTSPMPTHQEWFDSIRNLQVPKELEKMGMRNFSSEEKTLILGGNARSILRI